MIRPDRARLARLVTAVVVVAVAMSGCASLFDPYAGEDDKEFDKIQVAFDENPTGFVGAVNYIERLNDVNPDAEQIKWIVSELCVTGVGGTEVCNDASAADAAAFEPLPARVTGVVYYAKDPDRVFVVFNAPEPTIVYAMYAPGDEHPGDFAKERGFRSYRELGDGWTLLGSIDDRDANDDQFPWPKYPDLS